MDSVKQKFLYYGVLLCAVALSAWLAALVPMHSDDYGFYLTSLNLEHIIGRYLSWTGRIIPEILAPVLNKQPTLVKGLSTGLALVALVWAASSILPQKLEGGVEPTAYRAKTLSFMLIFSLYYLLNPTLGQSTFWLTGAANYLWPALFFTLYIKFSLDYAYNRKIRSLLLSVALAIVVGLSNEGAGAAAVIFSLGLLYIHRNNVNIRAYLILISIICLAACAILYLSPGNFIRAAREKPELFNLYEFIQRIPYAISRVMEKSSLFLPLPIFLYYFIIKKRNTIKNTCREQTRILILISIVLLAEVLIISYFITAPRRAMLTLFTLALCLIALQLSIIPRIITPTLKKIFRILIIICVFAFIGKIFLLGRIYISLNNQQQIREKIIAESRAERVIRVPDFYYPQPKLKYDRVDTWLKYTQSMSAFYKVSSIHFFDSRYNYGIINELQNSFNFDHKFFNIYFQNNIFDRFIVIGLKHEDRSSIYSFIQIKLYSTDNKLYDIAIDNSIYINLIEYFGTQLPLKQENIKRIEGYHDGKLIFIHNMV